MELTIEQALQQGIAAHKEGKLQDAERLYRAILQSQPLHPDANHNLGVMAVSVNKTDAALPLFKTALKANSKIEQFWLSYIDALIKTEKFDDARQATAEAKQSGITAAKLQIFEEQLEFELSPNSQIPHQEFGNQLQSHQDDLSPAIELREVGKYREAQKWLSNFIEHDSKNADALSLLSQVLLLDKKEAEAERLLSEAASIEPELPSVYRNQARLLLKQSKTAEALEKAQLGFRQSPEDSESLLVLAACLGANQRDLEALTIIEKILKAEPNHAEAYANRTLIKLRAKDTVSAIEDAKMTVSLKPHLTQMWQLLSSLYYQNSNLSDAIEALRSAHKNEPENPDFIVQLGEFLRQDNKVSEAITILEKAIELAPKDAKAWTNLGVAFQQGKRIADAKIAFEKALALNPKSAAISSNLGAMAKEAEEWELALQYFRKALEIEPNLAEAHSNLGVMLKELGRLDEAAASYTQAIALKPDFFEAHYNLGNTLKELGRLDEAEASYTQAIALKPDYVSALENRWQLLFDKKEFDAALRDIDLCNTIKSRACSLETLYALGNIEEIYKRIEMWAKFDDDNIRMAAFSSFISEREKRNTAHNFCRNPKSFVYFSNISSHLEDASKFITGILEELNKMETIWEPSGRTTVKGFQTPKHTNVFANPSGKMRQLKSIILNELDAYYLKFQREQCSYIQKFPTTRNLFGWNVILKQQGHQDAHIHTSGWLSGVIYLKVVPSLGKDEGAIEFSLNGKNYSDLKSPKLLYQPAQGDIVFFPSSLHHKTIPFTTDADRIIVSFDLLPEAGKN